MSFIKKNIKCIIGILIGVFLAGGSIFAYSYFANDISYTKQGSEDETTVEAALNDLYTKSDLTSRTQATATASDILSSKTAWVNGQLVTGTYVTAEKRAIKRNVNPTTDSVTFDNLRFYTWNSTC